MFKPILQKDIKPPWFRLGLAEKSSRTNGGEYKQNGAAATSPHGLPLRQDSGHVPAQFHGDGDGDTLLLEGTVSPSCHLVTHQALQHQHLTQNHGIVKVGKDC